MWANYTCGPGFLIMFGIVSGSWGSYKFNRRTGSSLAREWSPHHLHYSRSFEWTQNMIWKTPDVPCTPPKINIEPENDGLEVWKMFLLFQGCILRFHVNLPGCMEYLPAWKVKNGQKLRGYKSLQIPNRHQTTTMNFPTSSNAPGNTKLTNCVCFFFWSWKEV